MHKKEQNASKTLDRLFEDFYAAASGTFEALEASYGVKGVCDQIFGKDADEPTARANLRKSEAWQTLLELYDYAINGIVPRNHHESDLVVGASAVLKLASSENHWVSDEWHNIIGTGDSRYAMDEGSPLHLEQIALLANVDIRTVRNAVSAGDLVSYKSEISGEVFVEAASARRWLHGRRGFKPTVINDIATDLDKVTTPAAFGALLSSQRSRMDQEGEGAKRAVAHPSVTRETLAQLESGIFTLPLDAVTPLADFYLLDRRKLLRCVMRVFFYEEMQLLRDDEA